MSLINLLSDRGDLANAGPLCRRVLEARNSNLGPEHPPKRVEAALAQTAANP